MKRFLITLLLLCILISCGACGAESENSVTFYYLRTEDAIRYGSSDALIAPVSHTFSGELPLADLLQLYFSTPAMDGCQNPMPKGTYVLSATCQEDTVSLVLSREFSALEDIRLSLAAACLTSTCHSLTGLEALQVRSGEEIYEFNLSDFVFLDEGAGK